VPKKALSLSMSGCLHASCLMSVINNFMKFLDNKYTKTYFNIIASANTRVIEGYVEKHHIIPKSFGGTNHSNNLVKLTAREHFICHLLLVRMTQGGNQTKMLRAIQAFGKLKKTNRSLTARQYQLARTLTADLPSWNKGKTLADYTPEQKEALRKSGITKRGRTQTAEANAKRSATQSGRPAHNKGKPMPFKGRVSPTKGITHPKKPCPHCSKEVAANIMAKYHGDRCQFSPQHAYMSSQLDASSCLR
jgi:hypothetical protein